MKCFIAESELACFLLEKANSTDLPLDETFQLKHLVDRVKTLIHRIQESDHDRLPDKLPVYPQWVVPTGLPRYACGIVTSPVERLLQGKF